MERSTQPAAFDLDRDLIAASEAAAILGITRQAVSLRVRKGTLPHLTVAGIRFFLRATVEAMAAKEADRWE